MAFISIARICLRIARIAQKIKKNSKLIQENKKFLYIYWIIFYIKKKKTSFMMALFLWIFFFLSFSNTLSFMSQPIFQLAFRNLDDIYAYSIDHENQYIVFFSQKRHLFINSLEKSSEKYEINLSMNFSNSFEIENNWSYYRISFSYPYGAIILNNTLLKLKCIAHSDIIKLFGLNYFSMKNDLILFNENMFILGINKTLTIKNFLLLNESNNIFPFQKVNSTNLANENANKTNNPIEIFTIGGDEFNLYLMNKAYAKLRHFQIDPTSIQTKVIKETLDKSSIFCKDQANTKNDIDFELDSNFFLMTCREQIFIASFEESEISFPIKKFFYKNFDEKLFEEDIHLQIIESFSTHLTYSIYNSGVICYYFYEMFLRNSTNSTNQPRRILCMKNTVANTSIEEIYLNKNDKYINIFMRNLTDGKIFTPSFHKCVLNMKLSNFICLICDSIYCVNRCEKYIYPGCVTFLEFQRVLFTGILTLLFLLLIIVFLSSLYKNKLALLRLFCSIFLLLFKIKYVFLFIWEKRKNMTRSLKYVKSYLIFIFKCGFSKLDEEKFCPICLEILKAKPITTFACGRHEVHLECYKSYEESNLELNKKEGCPFRDV